MYPTTAVPPDDLDRLAAAWLKLQQLVNDKLPYYAGRMANLHAQIRK